MNQQNLNPPTAPYFLHDEVLSPTIMSNLQPRFNQFAQIHHSSPANSFPIFPTVSFPPEARWCGGV